MLAPASVTGSEAAVRWGLEPRHRYCRRCSGKTRTLTHKIAYHVNELMLDPARILAITFTNKSAAEMKGLLQEITAPDSRISLGAHIPQRLFQNPQGTLSPAR